ncbi:IclR family transcriptional regulator C-terminal domain-containing protein [Streptomyces sp. NBC_00083]|uniref:IclR family transcriptional regulator domain-containing protein n=1 Tax=Streptomyces sp. NBC_00083 TaxID=2975647 RepID=UPI0022513B9B|nr:IclR family transcriptional regulator C-terminal domain-containing protein [Streptomyces sp. NBC_00083]MCX5388056.1 helix-turn-helix domain-containing protein [Streptomyces sp. NBC_00083]
MSTAPAEAVGPLMRGVAVLRALGEADGRLTLGELVRATGLARSTVDRVAATLARMGYLRLDGPTATLAPRLMELANAYLGALRLPALFGPCAARLAEELDESVSLAVPDGDGIRFVHQSTRHRAMSLTFRIGDLLPAERTAPGPLFAAHWAPEQWTAWRARRATGPGDAAPGDAALPGVEDRVEAHFEERFEERVTEARAEGCAVDDQLIEPGLIAVAVPVHAPDGTPVCAVSVVSHTSRHSADSLRAAVLHRLRTAADAMEAALARDHTTTGASTPSPPPRPLAAWTSASKQELGSEFVESLARGLTVLTAFGAGRAALSLSAVAEATGLARATARRALITLDHLGLVATEGRVFRLTPRVLALGCPPLSRTTLPDIAAPHLAALARTVHDSASLAVLDGDAIRYTARVATSRIMSVTITLGTRFPAYATAMGRVLLADLPVAERARRLGRTELSALTPHTITSPAVLTALLAQVAEQGYAVVDEELEEGLRSLAVPVRDAGGRAVAAVNVAMHTTRRTRAECLDQVLPQMRATVAAIEAELHVVGRFCPAPAA